MLKHFQEGSDAGRVWWSARRRDPLPKLNKLLEPVTLDSSKKRSHVVAASSWCIVFAGCATGT
jgi:hypothetical protein